jgi:outer membrane protein OmpA-like peptidoglycan-associated protein
MTMNLLEMIGSYVTPDVVQKLSALVGERPASTEKGLQAAVPTILGGLISNTSSASGSSWILNLLLSQPGRDEDIAKTISSVLSIGSAQKVSESGQGVLSGIFGDTLSSVVQLISNHAGINTSTASSLLVVAARLVMGVLSRQVTTQKLDAPGLSNLLMSQKNSVADYAPPGLARILGVTGLSGPASPATERAAPAGTVREGGFGLRYVWSFAVLALLVFAIASWLLANRRARQENLATLALPNGSSLSVADNTINYELAQLLASGANNQVPKRFVFDHLNFEQGTADLTGDSNGTVDDLIMILKAYPAAEVRLEGYTDNTGDAATNKKLSLDRANAVKNVIVQAGIPENRISTAGYGSDNPIASNDSEDGRAKNRRTELVVVKF